MLFIVCYQCIIGTYIRSWQLQFLRCNSVLVYGTLQEVLQEIVITAEAEARPAMEVETSPPLDEATKEKANLIAKLQDIVHDNQLDN